MRSLDWGRTMSHGLGMILVREGQVLQLLKGSLVCIHDPAELQLEGIMEGKEGLVRCPNQPMLTHALNSLVKGLSSLLKEFRDFGIRYNDNLEDLLATRSEGTQGLLYFPTLEFWKERFERFQ